MPTAFVVVRKHQTFNLSTIHYSLFWNLQTRYRRSWGGLTSCAGKGGKAGVSWVAKKVEIFALKPLDSGGGMGYNARIFLDRIRPMPDLEGEDGFSGTWLRGCAASGTEG